MSFDVEVSFSNFNKLKKIVLPICRFPHPDRHTFSRIKQSK